MTKNQVYSDCARKLGELRATLSSIEVTYGHLAVDDRIPSDLQLEIECLLATAEEDQLRADDAEGRITDIERDAADREEALTGALREARDFLESLPEFNDKQQEEKSIRVLSAITEAL